MLADNKKISIRQAMFLFLTIIFTPTVRIISVYAAQRAKQAAWLAPIFAVLILLLIILVWQAIYKKYKDCSLMDIYSDITGSIIGKVLMVFHLLWLILLSALYVRYFASRLVGSIYPNISASIFMISMLVAISYTLRYGLQTLARLNEIVLPLLTGAFFILLALMMPNIKVRFLTPISYRSILPIFYGSMGTTGILVYYSLLFIVGDKINNKDKIKKTGVSLSLFLLIALTAVIVISLGTFNYSVVQRAQLPFLVAVKQISLFNTLENIESIVIAFWVVSDFVLISMFTYLTLHILKYLFRLSDTKPLINIYLIFLYIVSLLLADSAFEMQQLSDDFFIPLNILFGGVVPILMFFIGKIRKKV